MINYSDILRSKLYSGKLLKEKTFANFAVLRLFVKVFSVKFGGVASFVKVFSVKFEGVASFVKVFSAKIVFVTSSLPRKFATIW